MWGRSPSLEHSALLDHPREHQKTSGCLVHSLWQFLNVPRGLQLQIYSYGKQGWEDLNCKPVWAAKSMLIIKSLGQRDSSKSLYLHLSKLKHLLSFLPCWPLLAIKPLRRVLSHLCSPWEVAQCCPEMTPSGYSLAPDRLRFWLPRDMVLVLDTTQGPMFYSSTQESYCLSHRWMLEWERSKQKYFS